MKHFLLFYDVDPYVRNGLVKTWRVREWTTVVGEGAATPVAADQAARGR